MTRQQEAQAKRERRAARNLYHPTAHSSYAVANLTDRAKGLRQRLALERHAHHARVEDARRARERVRRHLRNVSFLGAVAAVMGGKRDGGAS